MLTGTIEEYHMLIFTLALVALMDVARVIFYYPHEREDDDEE